MPITVHQLALRAVRKATTGDLKLHLIGDGAGALTPSLSRRKACMAAMRRASSGELVKQVAAPGAFNPTLYDRQLVAAGGGVPIKVSETRSSAALVSVARRVATRMKPAPMLVSLRSVIG